MSHANFIEQMEELESAEDFLDFFTVPYDPAVVNVNRLHILQRFHDYLRGAGQKPEFETWRGLLARAYEDFVHSTPQAEGVFRVFKRAQGIATVPITSIGRAQS
jgi:nitrogenase-stabilizing/protective protein